MLGDSLPSSRLLRRRASTLAKSSQERGVVPKQQVLHTVIWGVFGSVSALFLRRHELPFLPTALGIAIMGQCLWAMLRRCSKAWPEAKRSWLRMSVRSMRCLRRLYRASPGVAFLAPVSMFLVLSSGLVALLLFSTPIFYVGAWVFGMLLGWMGAAECVQRTRRLMVMAWARVTGRITLLGLGALVCIVAHVWANHLAHEINPIDPKFFPNFVALSTVVLSPFLYLYGFATLVAAWAVFELFVLVILYTANQALRVLATVLGRVHRHDIIVYRLVYGRRPAGSHERELFEEGLVFFQRTLSMAVFVVGIFLTLGQLVDGRKMRLQSMSRSALVAVDYLSGGQCGSSQLDSYLPLGYGLTSIAHHHAQGVIFEVIRCPGILQPETLSADTHGFSEADLSKNHTVNGAEVVEGKTTK